MNAPLFLAVAALAATAPVGTAAEAAPSTSQLDAAALQAAADGGPATATPGFGGSLVLPGATFALGFAEPGWKATHGGVDDARQGPGAFRVRVCSDPVYVRGSAAFSEAPGGGVRAEWNAAADSDARVGEFFVSANFPVADFGGGRAVLDGGARDVALPAGMADEPHLFRGKVSALSLFGRDGAERLAVAFDAPSEILLQDNRKWGNETFTLRLFAGCGSTLRAGERAALAATFRTPSAGLLALGPKRTWKAEPGPDWTPVATEPWIEPGSALDFSGVVPHHAPAGKFGRVIAVGDHFEFEGLPGVPQRFYGVNINGEANTPSTPEAAERFAANLARMGYNALRIHHHGRALLSEPGHINEPDRCADDTRPDPAAMDRFDALVAACVRHGIYLTTDLCVSRSHYVKWRSLGIDRDGYITRIHDYKVLCSFWEPAYSNLCAWSRNFLCHVNPYTGRSLAEEPALCTLALINEGNLGNQGSGALRKLPGVKEAWEEWLAAKSGDPAFAGIPQSFPADLYADDGATPERRHAAAFAQFLADREIRLFDRLSAFVRDELRCAAPLSNLSSWYDPVQYQLPRSRFDYVDGHSYIDHPSFLDEQWKLPSRCPNANPVGGAAAGVPPVAYRRLLEKPFCITEWNYSGPGRYRGLGGIAFGTLGALQDWSGMWRFAWCHGREGVESPETKRMGYFDMAGDPLSLAAERAALCLFLRADQAPLGAEAPLALDEAVLRDPAAGAQKIGSQVRLADAWRSRVGTVLGGRRPPAAPAGDGSVRVDPAAGTFVIDTPRTAGGFAESGVLDCGPLRFEIVESQKVESRHPAGARRPPNVEKSTADIRQPTSGDLRPSGLSTCQPFNLSTDCSGGAVAATVWASSLDDAPIAESSRILVTHLTDVQNCGIEYADPELTTLLKWGGLPHLMRNGAADVSITLAPAGGGAEPPVVWRLSPSGRRLGRIPSQFDSGSGILRFTARTNYDPDAATFLYEICRS